MFVIFCVCSGRFGMFLAEMHDEQEHIAHVLFWRFLVLFRQKYIVNTNTLRASMFVLLGVFFGRFGMFLAEMHREHENVASFPFLVARAPFPFLVWCKLWKGGDLN